MENEEIRQVAELIALRLKQGWDSQADRIWERALRNGADFAELEEAIFEARYGKE